MSRFGASLLGFLGTLLPIGALAGPWLPPEDLHLANGVSLVSQGWEEESGAERVHLAFAFRGGLIEEAPSSRGLTHWLLQGLTRAASDQLTHARLAETVTIGAELDAEYASVTLVMPAEQFPQVWPPLIDLLFGPAESWIKYAPAPADEVARLEQLRADPAFMTDLLLRSTLLGSSPYVNPPAGTPQSVADFDVKHLAEFGARLLQPERLIVGVVHAPSVRLDELQVRLGALESTAKSPLPGPRPVPEVQGPTELLRPMEGVAPTMVLGFSGPGISDPELPAFLVAAAALGDPQSGRLAAMAAPDPGQALQVIWNIDRHRQTSTATFHFAMAPGGDIFALHDRAVAIVENALAEGLSEAEIARAQGLLSASSNNRESIPEAMASWLVQWSVWESIAVGRRFERKIDTLSPEAVNAALREFFARERRVAAGLAPNLPDAYYKVDPTDVFWGTFKRPAPGLP